MSIFLSIWTIFLGAVLLTVIVSIHEAGHFFAGKFFRVKVEEFGFGWPPRIWGKKVGETIYSINAILAGGFVRLFGQECEEADNPRSFASKGPWVRTAIIVAGVMMNLLAAFILFGLFVASGGFRTDIPVSIPTSGKSLQLSFPFGQQTEAVMIDFVVPGSPAMEAGFKALDEIVVADGQQFPSVSSFQEFVQGKKGRLITFQVYNLLDRNYRTLAAVPRVNPPENEGALGVSLSEVAVVRYEGLAEKIFVGPAHAANMLYYQGKALSSLVSQSFEERSAAPLAQTVSGPVGIVTLIGRFIGATGARGIWALIEVVALLNLILAVVNMLPIPAADGGRFYFTAFEGLTGKKINPALERSINSVGFALLVILFFLITYNDIVKIFR